MIGVAPSLVSGRGPRLSVLNRQATCSLLKLLALIWSTGEYLDPLMSAVYIGQSPFFVLGIGLACPETSGDSHASPAASSATAGTTRMTERFILVYSSAETGRRGGILRIPATHHSAEPGKGAIAKSSR